MFLKIRLANLKNKLIFISLILLNLVIFPMQYNKNINNNNNCFIDIMPNEILTKILEYVIYKNIDKTKNFDEILNEFKDIKKSIQNIALVNKNFNKLINKNSFKKNLFSCFDVKEQETLLFKFIKNKNLNIFSKILIDKVDLNAKNQNSNSFLILAIEHNNLEIAKCLIESDINITTQNNDDNTALISASYMGHLEIAEALLNKIKHLKKIINDLVLNKNINNRDKNIIIDLVAKISKSKIEYNLKNKLLTKKIQDNYSSIIQFLDNYINMKNNFGFTALICSIVNNKLDVFKFLIKNGANIEEKGNYGNTALIWATLYNNLDMIKILIENNANINTQDTNGTTALMHAVLNKSLKTIKYLVKKGANLDIQDRFGDTALILAAKKDDFKIFKYLLKNGANINLKDNYGDTVLNIAIEKNNSNIINYLQNLI